MTSYYGMKEFLSEDIQADFRIYVDEAFKTYTGKKWTKFVDNFLFREYERVKHICHKGKLPYLGNKYYKDTPVQEKWIIASIKYNNDYTGKDIFDYIDMHCYVEFERFLKAEEGYGFMTERSQSVMEAYNDATSKFQALKLEIPIKRREMSWLEEAQTKADKWRDENKEVILEQERKEKEAYINIKKTEFEVMKTMPITFNPKYEYNSAQLSLLTPSQRAQVDDYKKWLGKSPEHRFDTYEKEKMYEAAQKRIVKYQMNMEGAPMPEMRAKMAGIEENLSQISEQFVDTTPAYTMNTINENWNITDIAKRPVRMEPFLWTTAQDHLDEIFSLSPREVLASMPQLSSMIQSLMIIEA